LPPSVRFWQRRVYWAPVVLLVSALRQGQNPDITFERLKGLCGVWRSTVKRWLRYFKELFAHSVNYRRLSGHLMPPIDADQLPGGLLARFCQTFCDPMIALIQCLQTLALGP
jgi:hypothetical protein